MKCLVADDEKYMREALVESVDWKKYGIEEVMQAKDGEEALQICKWFKPEIIISDIQMPRMTGIDFTSKILKICPESKIIFITAYMEVDYLKSAIQLSALDFIEKPFSMQTVVEAIKKAVSEVKKQHSVHKSVKQEQTLSAEKLTNILRYRKNQDREMIENLCDKVGFPKDKHYLAYLVSKRGKEDFLEGEIKEIREFMENNSCQMIGTTIDADLFLGIVACTEYEKMRVQLLLKKFANLNQQYIIGVGFFAEHLFSVSESYQIAARNNDRAFYHKECNYFEMENSIPNMEKLPASMYTQFYNLLDKDPQQMEHWIKEQMSMLKEKEHYPYSEVQRMVFQLVRVMTTQKKEILYGISGVYDEKGLEEYIMNLLYIVDLEDILLALYSKYRKLAEDNSQYSKLVREVISYIEKNCHRGDLDVSQIAEHVHFSNAHLNILFKQETGSTLKKFIKEYRITLSKNMLEDGHYKINEIAERCGYTNANYFSVAFKEATGESPSEYRKRIDNTK